MIPKIIVIHHTASRRNTTVEQVNAWHKARFDYISSLGSYIGYHYLITEDGKVTQNRRDNELGAHSIPNDGRLGICLTGNFQDEEPSQAQLDSLEVLVERIKKEYGIEQVKGHRECNRTECPGENLFIWVLKQRISWLQKLINLLLRKVV